MLSSGGFGDEVDSQILYSTFLPFGEVLDVQLPPDPAKRESRTYRPADAGSILLDTDK